MKTKLLFLFAVLLTFSGVCAADRLQAASQQCKLQVEVEAEENSLQVTGDRLQQEEESTEQQLVTFDEYCEFHQPHRDFRT